VTERTRSIVYIVAALAVFALLAFAGNGLAEFGTFTGPYTQAMIRETMPLRHIYNVPTAINFDFRGFDTLGEEFIFFTSVAGVLLIFSPTSEKAPEAAQPLEAAEAPANTGLIRWFGIALAAFGVGLAIDMGAHGQLTPGGGFQGGAIFGSAIACVYLGVGWYGLQKTASKEVFDALEGIGAMAYGLIGIATMVAAGAFLVNCLPLGKLGATISGGTIYAINAGVFVEIGAGFTVLVVTLIRQMQYSSDTSGS
jgi:multicomponent Na+:H+ antiporter subunit B